MTSLQSNLLVIGGTSSLSHEIIELALSKNYRIYFTDRTSSGPTPKGTRIKLDLADDLDIASFLDDIGETSFDLIVFAIGELSKIQSEFSEIKFRKYMETHITNTILVVKKALTHLMKDGTFIYISSRSANHRSFDPYYSASKAALQAFLRSYTNYLHPNQKVFSIAPSLIENSNMYRQMSGDDHNRHRLRANGVLLTLAEVSRFILNVHSKKSNFGTGEIIPLGNEEK